MKVFYDRPASFSLVVFRGDYLAALDEFLQACQYQILEKSPVSGLPSDIYAGLPDQVMPNNTLVFKAAYVADGHTILFEPEMVLAATCKDQLSRFCSERHTEVACAIWERVSETAAFLEFSEAGLLREAWYPAGRQMQPPLDPPTSLTTSPDAVGVLRSLREWGMPESVFVGPRTGVRYKLKE